MSTSVEPGATMHSHAAPPVPADANAQDIEHLRLLSIFHYVVAAITALFSLFPVIHLAIGLGLVSGRVDDTDPEAVMVGWVFVGIAIVFAGLLAYAGRCLAQNRRYTFCLVIAAISCMFIPFGTVLGVFTLVILVKPSVKQRFNVP